MKKKLEKLRNEIRKKHNVDVYTHDKIIDYIVDENLDTESDSGGARIIMSKLETEVTTAIARYINAHPEDRKIAVKVIGEMASENKNMLKSRAHIEVMAITDRGTLIKKR